MRDTIKIQEQELKNYNRAKEIFNDILKGKTPQYKQMPDLSVSDMRMQVGTNYYNIELKSRSTSIYTYNEMPLKCKKYCNLVKDTDDDETLLYMALVEDGNYYIWNLSELQLCECRMDNMWAKKQEYNIGGTYNVQEPYLFIPLDKAVLRGFDPNEDN